MTDQLRQAAQQALEALCSAVEPKNGKVYARGFEPIDCYAMHEQAITALKAALEQQAEPPPEWPLIKNILAVFGLDAIAFVAAWKAAQQQAEPVQERITHITWDERGVRTVNGIPDDAPQRQWQGLTDEEITELDMEISGRTMDECVRAIEDKLKEKNDH